MGHLPRWGGSDVDSQAMLSAYLYWTAHADPAEADALIPHLHTVDHQHLLPGPLLPPRVRGQDIPAFPCTEHNCRRCAERRGGYMFRWIDKRWLASYEQMRRAGSWSSLLLDLPRQEASGDTWDAGADGK